MNTFSTVGDVNHEITEITKMCELIQKLTVSEHGTTCSGEDIKIKSSDLRAMQLRLYDLKSYYLNCQVELLIVCRNGN